MGDKRVPKFLKIISQIESSGGKNFNHPEIKQGLHQGTSGIGRYGLMPNTVNEVINRLRLSGKLTPEIKKLQKLEPNALKEILESNPHIEDKIAEELASRVLARQPDEEMAAYSWTMGHNLTPERIKSEPYQDSDYVKKYNSYKKLVSGDDNE